MQGMPESLLYKWSPLSQVSSMDQILICLCTFTNPNLFSYQLRSINAAKESKEQRVNCNSTKSKAIHPHLQEHTYKEDSFPHLTKLCCCMQSALVSVQCRLLSVSSDKIMMKDLFVWYHLTSSCVTLHSSEWQSVTDYCRPIVVYHWDSGWVRKWNGKKVIR